LKAGVLHVWLTEAPEGNKANRQLVKELARVFGSCRLVRGASSRSKVLELPVASEEGLKVYLSKQGLWERK